MGTKERILEPETEVHKAKARGQETVELVKDRDVTQPRARGQLIARPLEKTNAH